MVCCRFALGRLDGHFGLGSTREDVVEFHEAVFVEFFPSELSESGLLWDLTSGVLPM